MPLGLLMIERFGNLFRRQNCRLTTLDQWEFDTPCFGRSRDRWRCQATPQQIRHSVFQLPAIMNGTKLDLPDKVAGKVQGGFHSPILLVFQLSVKPAIRALVKPPQIPFGIQVSSLLASALAASLKGRPQNSRKGARFLPVILE